MAEQTQSDRRHQAGTPMQAPYRSRIPVFALGMSLSLFLVVTYLICIGFDLLFPAHAMYPAWAQFLPGFSWLTLPGFLLGLIESFAYGWYVALIFGPLFNLFSRMWK